MAVFAHEQHAGKGQRTKSWTSQKSANITLSLLLEAPKLQLTEQFQLSACMAVAIRDFFSKYAGEAKIKWPNDLYWQDRKAGGVLIENVVGSLELGVRSSELGVRSSELGVEEVGSFNKQTQWKWAIVGVGININQTEFPAELPNPVSLKQITGKDFDSVQLAKELILCVNKWYNELSANGFENIYQLYNEHLYKKGQKVNFRKNNSVFEATVKSVSPGGSLTVQHSIGEEYQFGDIEWIL
jgi:BirA family biotin operon repressor/biotin-[acetyl-CoA-carboxylase] ligase